MIKGFVRDNKTNEPLSNVIISAPPDYSAVTDIRGYFELKVNPGTYIIRAYRMGYEQEFRTVTLLSNETKDLFIELRPKEYILDTVIVSAKQDVSDITPNSFELYQGDLKNIPQVGEADAFRPLITLPGITSTSDFDNQLFVRGGNFDETLIALDGVPLYNPYHLGGIFSSVNTDVISSERIYLSNYPASIGGYLSGALDIKTKAGNNEAIRTAGTLSLFSSRAFINGPLGKGTFILSARRTYFDLIAMMLKEQLPYYFYDAYAKYTLPLRDDLFSISFFYSKDRLKLFPEIFHPGMKATEDPNWGNLILSMDWSHEQNRNTIIKSKIFISNSYVNSEGIEEASYVGTDLNRFDLNNQITDYTFSTALTTELKKMKIEAGLEAKHLTLNYFWHTGYIGPARDYLRPVEDVFFDYAPTLYEKSYSGSFVNGYMFLNFPLSERISMEAGLRGSYYHQIRHFNIYPQVNIDVKLFGNSYLSLRYGKYYQHLYTFKEKRNASIYSPFSVFFLAEDKNKIGGSDHYSAAFITPELLPYLDFKVEGYYKKRTNLSASYNIAPRYRFEDGYAYGIEASVNHKAGRFKNSASYSFSRSIKKGTGYDYFSGYDRTHSIKLTVGYDLSEKWRLNSYWTYASGIPYTPVIGKYKGSYDFRDDVRLYDVIPPGLMEWRPLYAAKNSIRMNDHHRLDLGITGSFIWGKYLLNPYLQIMNVYSSPNNFFYSVEFENDAESSEVYRGSFIIPTIGVTIEF